MKKYCLHILVLAAIFMASCKKEDNLDKPLVGLGGDTWAKTALDNWLYSTFTQPYNLEVKYRWDGSELDPTKTLVPPDSSRVRPLMEMVNSSWIEPYVSVKGAEFIKRYSPKQYMLVGSVEYNTGGTVKLGEAEGGFRVTLYNVNNFVKSNRANAQQVLKTIHHEFTHILHQTVEIPKEYPLLTGGSYTSDWNNQTLTEALSLGYVSQYSRAAPNEDFAEMVSIMLTQGRGGYETLLRTAGTNLTVIRKKESIVIGYFKQTWGIDFTTLQTKVQKDLNSYSKAPVFSQIGFGKAFSSITITPAQVGGQSDKFNTAWETAKASFQKYSSTAVYALESMNIVFATATTMQLKVNFRATAGANLGTLYTATYTYNVAANATAETYAFAYASADANGTSLAAAAKPLTDYFTGNFAMKYFYGSDAAVEFGGVQKADDATSFTFGILNL
ncbi:substrate import-associated zinc metallohydrolase lipoprotein [Chitinophaga jiangningensis]|uniref:Substrate import-associated zinc metallohydrolase lipoprotein n=1 Tax=Chitinophaga jiangningensis TaxID=1419482 RepID=A0A1M7EBD0_9BACT|nr:putative zinc-binding metallopeptidase [Chitinophaga jiangningensis]SHL89072.1 substrate import-associated zinc metallohydrolase lipoprotein [Chitinophaga jiangningensis]